MASRFRPLRSPAGRILLAAFAGAVLVADLWLADRLNLPSLVELLGHVAGLVFSPFAPAILLLAAVIVLAYVPAVVAAGVVVALALDAP